MRKFALRISSYEGLVPGARHWRGRVEGESERSCHGSIRINPPEHRGKTVCSEGHEIPDRISWDVEESWTEERYNRWADQSFEGDGPAQFKTQEQVVEAARKRFLGEWPSQWWEEPVPTPQSGDRLYLGYIPRDGDAPEDDGYGGLIAEVKET